MRKAKQLSQLELESLYKDEEDKKRLMEMSVFEREKELTRRYESMIESKHQSEFAANRLVETQSNKKISAKTKKRRKEETSDSEASEASDDDKDVSSYSGKSDSTSSEESSEWEEETSKKKERIKNKPQKKSTLFRDDKLDPLSKEEPPAPTPSQTQEAAVRSETHQEREKDSNRSYKIKKLSKLSTDLQKSVESCRITSKQASYFLEHPRASVFFINSMILFGEGEKRINLEQGTTTFDKVSIARIVRLTSLNRHSDTLFEIYVGDNSSPEFTRKIGIDRISDEPITTQFIEEYKRNMEDSSLDDVSRVIEFFVKEAPQKSESIRNFNFTDADVSAMLNEKQQVAQSSDNATPKISFKGQETKHIEERKLKLHTKKQLLISRLKDSECTAQNRIECRNSLKEIDQELEFLSKIPADPIDHKPQSMKGPVNVVNLPPIKSRRQHTVNQFRAQQDKPVENGVFNYLKKILQRTGDDGSSSIEEIWGTDEVVGAAKNSIS
eukprot:GHVP01053544.1.p1 GENE.GHVP01053544.1~~GHVP01053544.1.p1  ORF type:complete len:515 (+),score=131.15 GHVP01053544.1:53-1546(+)